MIFLLIECSYNTSSIIPEGTFLFLIPNRNERAGCVEGILDQFIDLFRIISFIYDKEVRRSCSVTLSQKFFRVNDLMDQSP